MTSKPLVTHAAAEYPYSDKIAAAYTFESRFGGEVRMYLRVGDRIYLPRETCPLSDDDQREDGEAIRFANLFEPRSEDQARVVRESVQLLRAGRSHILQAMTGFGKSTVRGTRVIRADGTVDVVENVRDGDLLMGPDSTPRRVTGTRRWLDPCYRIVPTKGEPWECNEDHVLCLRRTNYFQKNGSGGGGRMRGGDLVYITVRDYLKQSNNFRRIFKLWRAPGIDLPARGVWEPYVVGLYLADGNRARQPILYCGEIKKPALDYVELVTRVGRKTFRQGTWKYTLPEFRELQPTLLTADRQRHIPDDYLLNSRGNRLQLLAGILDGDGSLVRGTVFDLCCKDEHFKEQVLYLARSLGLVAYASKCKKGIRATGFIGEYWRVIISGNTDIIPTKIPSKQAAPRRQKKDALCTGFTVVPVGPKECCGIALDGDNLFLLWDFTVTHNTFIGCAIAAAMGRRTLVITTKEDIIDQWVAAAERVLNLPVESVGIWRGDSVPPPDKPFVVGLVQSLMRGPERYGEDAYRGFGLLLVDECFHPSHELLTLSGWKPVAGVTAEDRVAQVNAVTKLVSFVAPTEIVHRQFSGELVSLTNQRCDLLATPDHQHLVYWRGDEPRKVSYEKFNPTNRWKQLYAGFVPGAGALTAWERLCVAYQADGTYLRYGVRQEEHNFRFAFRKARKVERLLRILADVRAEFGGGLIRWRQNSNHRGDTLIVVWCQARPPEDFSWVSLSRSSEYYRSFLAEVVEWDGWHRQEQSFYSNTDFKCVDMVQACASLAGYVTTKFDRARVGAKTSADCLREHRVSWYEGALRDTKALHKTTVPYTGMVHCVRVPAGNLITRRNGKVVVTGNCHRIAAEQFSQAMWRFRARLRLGLSATPYRRDGRGPVFAGHIGEVLVQAKTGILVPKVLLRRTGWRVPIVRWYGQEQPLPHVPGRTAHVDKILGRDAARNLEIARFVAAAESKGRHTIVFSSQIEHLWAVERALLSLGIPQAAIGYYVGQQNYAGPPAERQRQRDEARSRPIILATYGMGAEGSDIPRLDTCVLGTPRADVTQIVGRIRRHHPDKRDPVVLDLIDDDSRVLAGFAARRQAWYRSIGASVIII